MAETVNEEPPFTVTRIAVIGAGPMGCSLAALTSQTIETVLVVRDSDRASTIRDHGIVLDGKELSATSRPLVVESTKALSGVGKIDVLFVATKTTAIRDVCESVRSILDPIPYIVSYQNGIDSGRAIMERLGTERVVRMVLRYGASFLPSTSQEPLHVRVGLHAPPHFIGGEGDALAVARSLARLLAKTGLPAEFTPDIEGEAWRKGIENAAGNPIAALVQAPLGELLESPGRALVERLLDEGIAVAKALGVHLPGDYRDRALRTMMRGGSHLPSMAQDVRDGRETELAQLNEQIAAKGRALGVPTPTHEAIIDLVGVFDWRAGRARGLHASAADGGERV